MREGRGLEVLGVLGELYRRLRCVFAGFSGWPSAVSTGPGLGEVARLAVGARRFAEKAAAELYREGRLEEGLVFEAVLAEIEEVENLLAEAEYLLSRLGLGEGFSK